MSIPNLLSLIRLVLVPVFAVVFSGPGRTPISGLR